MHGRPLATRAIREDDYLPLESYDLDRNADELLEPTFRYFVSATSLPGVGTFGREAQATYLFDRVRLSIEGGELSCNAYHVGRDLQNLLAVVMEQVAGRWGIYCGATQMLITYVASSFNAKCLYANMLAEACIIYTRRFTCTLISWLQHHTKRQLKWL